MKITFQNRIAQHFGKHYIEGHTMQNVITVKTKFSPLADLTRKDKKDRFRGIRKPGILLHSTIKFPPLSHGWRHLSTGYERWKINGCPRVGKKGRLAAGECSHCGGLV
jgi:hypothetical protein